MRIPNVTIIEIINPDLSSGFFINLKIINGKNIKLKTYSAFENLLWNTPYSLLSYSELNIFFIKLNEDLSSA